MRKKQKRATLSHEQALDIVRGYHLRGEKQQVLADRHGTNTGYVSRLVNGEARPECYEQISREESEEAQSKASG